MSLLTALIRHRPHQIHQRGQNRLLQHPPPFYEYRIFESSIVDINHLDSLLLDFVQKSSISEGHQHLGAILLHEVGATETERNQLESRQPGLLEGKQKADHLFAGKRAPGGRSRRQDAGADLEKSVPNSRKFQGVWEDGGQGDLSHLQNSLQVCSELPQKEAAHQTSPQTRLNRGQGESALSIAVCDEHQSA